VHPSGTLSLAASNLSRHHPRGVALNNGFRPSSSGPSLGRTFPDNCWQVSPVPILLVAHTCAPAVCFFESAAGVEPRQRACVSTKGGLFNNVG